MTNVVQPAGSTAAAAAVRIELVHSEPAARAAATVLAQVWATDDGHVPVVPGLVWVFAHAGHYVANVYADDRVIASAIGLRSCDARGDYVHSHIAGVLPAWQGTNVGFSLKQHQRGWALDNGFDRITWTFDPLVSRNAYFNVTKLGARLTDYYVNFYGPMDDGINGGDETDRCLAIWDLITDRAVDAAGGRQTAPDVTQLRDSGVPVRVQVGAGGEPLVNDDARGGRQLLQLPRDIVALRHSDRLLARAWRRVVRDILVPAFADGYEVTGVTRDAWYVLARQQKSPGPRGVRLPP